MIKSELVSKVVRYKGNYKNCHGIDYLIVKSYNDDNYFDLEALKKVSINDMINNKKVVYNNLFSVSKNDLIFKI